MHQIDDSASRRTLRSKSGANVAALADARWRAASAGTWCTRLIGVRLS